MREIVYLDEIEQKDISTMNEKKILESYNYDPQRFELGFELSRNEGKPDTYKLFAIDKYIEEDVET